MNRADHGSNVSLTRRFVGAALAALFAFACNGQVTPNSTGETHFLGACPSADGACASGLACLGGICSTACGVDVDCTAQGAGLVCESGRCNAPADKRDAGTTLEGGGGDACRTGCRQVLANPVDAARHCIDLATKASVGCDCSIEGSYTTSCSRRASDGTLWFYTADQLERADGFVECSTAERGTPTSSCDFASCPNGTTSFCSRADTCATRPCGGLEYDDMGCARAMCTTDGDCATDQRCTALSCADSSFCAYDSTGTCACGGPTICRSARECGPIAIAGPRGVWQEIDVLEGAGPCPDGQPCTWTWKASANGALAINKNGVASTAQLSQDDLSRLNQLIDGTEVRVGMRDGFKCDLPPTDVGYSLHLVLDTQSFDQDVTGCATTGPDNNTVKQITTMLTAY